MANVDKFTAGASGHLTAHFERRKNEKGEYVRFHNQNIDPDRIPLNYNLAPDRAGGQTEFIRQRMSEVRCQHRADVNVMCSWVITLPKEYSRADGLLGSWNKDAVERTFFDRTYRYLADKYGENNVVSAYVHMDEVTPHMHFAFVPVTEDKKRGGYKVSAKEVLTRKELQAFHGDLERYLDSFHDWQFKIVNDATKDGNRDVAELKIQAAHQEVVEAQREAVEARQSVEAIRGEADTLLGEKKALQNELEGLRSDILTTREVEALQGQKTLTGALKGVTYHEYEALKNTAVKVDSMAAERDQALTRAGVAELRADQATERAKLADAACKEALHLVEQSKDAVAFNKLQQAYNDLKSRLEIVERAFRYLLDKVKHLGYTYDSVISNVKRELGTHGSGEYKSAIERYKENSQKNSVVERINHAKNKSHGQER